MFHFQGVFPVLSCRRSILYYRSGIRLARVHGFDSTSSYGGDWWRN